MSSATFIHLYSSSGLFKVTSQKDESSLIGPLTRAWASSAHSALLVL